MRLFGNKPQPVDVDAAVRQGVQAAVAELIRAQIAVPGNPYGAPANSPTHGAYHFDNPIWFATPQSPKRRPGSLVDTQTLRQVADTYDVARSCINHLKREVAATPIRIAAKDPKDDSDATGRDIVDATAFFSRKGGLGGLGVRRSHFEGQVIEDVLVIGAAAIYHTPTRGGGVYESVPIAAETIRPVVDGYGWSSDPKDRYQQWIQGMKVASFGFEELTYDGIWPVSFSPYFRSPLEWLLSAIMSAIKADEWNRNWLVTGNTPSDLIALPDSWSPDQVMAFSEWFNAKLEGNSEERQKTRFVPSGSSRLQSNSRKDQDFQEFELWLLRRTCSIFGVQPASIGFTGEQYKVSQDASLKTTTQFGAGALLDFRKELYDDILERLGYEHLELVNVTDEAEDASKRTERNAKAVGGPWKTVNEARKEDGLDPVPDGNSILTPMGFGPLSSEPDAQDAASPDEDLTRWERKAVTRLGRGQSATCRFESDVIPTALRSEIDEGLQRAADRSDVRAVFAMARCSMLKSRAIAAWRAARA